MTAIADPPVPDPGPVHDAPGAPRSDVALFYSGLVAFTALLVFGALAVMAVLPLIVPGYTSLSIISGSMMPTLRVGDVLIAADHDGGEVAVDTVVVYEDLRRHDLVTHRVVAVNADGSYTTRGDAAGANDSRPVPDATIRSTGRWIVPFVGLPRVWVAHSRWLPLVLTIVVTALALWPVRFAFDPRYDPWPTAVRAGGDAAP